MTHVEVVALVAVLLVVLALGLYLGVVAARKQQLLARPGGLPLAVRAADGDWALGVGRYSGDELWWYSAFRLARRPTRTFRRRDLEITGQRGRRPAESILPVGSVVVECVDANTPVTLAFSQGAVTGFLSWLEASAPR